MSETASLSSSSAPGASLERYLAEARKSARELYQHLKKRLPTCRNETELRQQVDPFLRNFCERLGLPVEGRAEYTTAVGRLDTILGGVVLEYKAPGRLQQVGAKAIEQVLSYLKELEQKQGPQWPRLMGVVFDGEQIAFVRKREGRWLPEGPMPATEIPLRQLFYALTELTPDSFPLTAKRLSERFSLDQPYVQALLRALIRALEKALAEKSDKLPAKLFAQWKLFFGQSIDYSEAFGGTKLKKLQEWAGKVAGYTLHDPEEAQRFFFVLHTYFALLVKLLAWLALSRLMLGGKVGGSFSALTLLEAPQLLDRLSRIERGGLFPQYGLLNLLEGDFFAWYLEVWDVQLAEAVRELIRQLSAFNPAPLSTDREEARDLFKKLYHALLPREIRHNLGEYYTPDWLAEHLLAISAPELFGGAPVLPSDPEQADALRERLLSLRFLDPACGSGTFLVLILHRLLQWASYLSLPPGAFLCRLVQNVVGFDINPLAVLTARVNYLFAIADWLEFRECEIEIPVYLADSVQMPALGDTLLKQGVYTFPTSVGRFSVPERLVVQPAPGKASPFLRLCSLTEEALEVELRPERFLERVQKELRLSLEEAEAHLLQEAFYQPLLDLHTRRLNGIWTRILKNNLAPLVMGQFDYIVGNPPWINWEHLPDNYRANTKPLWEKYGIVGRGRGGQARLGAVKVDIAALMTYVVADKLLKLGGRLGFVVTQSLLKTSRAGFRRFVLPDGTPLQVRKAEDLVALNPFEGASNRTALLLLQKGQPTQYPVPYILWRKKAHGRISPEHSLKEVWDATERVPLVATPVDSSDRTSPWLTVPEGIIPILPKVLGPSDYEAHAGAYTGGLNAAYWVEVIKRLPGGKVLVRNLTEGSKIKVGKVTGQVEADLLYPLLRGRDVQRWKAQPSAWIIVPRLPSKPDEVIPEDKMTVDYPETYYWLYRFREPLRKRKDAMTQSALMRGEPFYFYGAVNDYTFAKWKVVWTRVGRILAAVIGPEEDKPVIPQETITLISCESPEEAHYIAAILNSLPFQYVVSSFAQEGGKSFGTPHILEQIRIPCYNSYDPIHRCLAKLSKKAHAAAAAGYERKLERVERGIDKVARRIWGLTIKEVEEIRKAMEEIG